MLGKLLSAGEESEFLQSKTIMDDGEYYEEVLGFQSGPWNNMGLCIKTILFYFLKKTYHNMTLFGWVTKLGGVGIMSRKVLE